MATALGSSLLSKLAGAVSPPGGALAEFGTYYDMVLVLCAINTVVCLYFLWRIFKNK